MPKKKLPVRTSVRLRAYTIIQQAVEVGVAHGHGRAHKHTETPSKDLYVSTVSDAVMNELSDILDFGDVVDE